jgi:hypothetical protein
LYRHRRPLRRWRLRGRKGQVAAVATILGLLIVVVYIANYLTAVLPGQMSANDLNHVVLVENQVGHFQALLQSASAVGAVGAELSQPITLGSAGQPPFADADSGSIGPAANGSYFQVNSTLSGPLAYSAPTGGTPNTGHDNPATGCTLTSGGAVCTGTNHLVYNWSGSDVAYTFTTTAGVYLINVTDSGASTVAPAAIALSAQGSAPVNLLVIGNNDTITVQIPTTGTVVNAIVFGNYDTFNVDVTAIGATERVTLEEVGLHDGNTLTAAPGLTFLASIFGSTDTVTGPTTANSNAGTKVGVYFSGFATGTAACPAGSLAASDSVATSSTAGTYTASYNVTAPFTPTTVADWTQTAYVVTPVATGCPFFTASIVPFDLAKASAGFDVHFANTYIPTGDVEFDQGAVIYAQAAGIPTMIDTPEISATYSGTVITGVTLWFPVFVGTLATDQGLSTATVATRLLSVNTIALTPQSSLGIANSTNIVVTVHSQFAAAWAAFFNTTYPFQNDWSCTPAGSAACVGPYTSGGPFGTVVLTIPTGTLLDSLTIQLATFNISLV